MSLVQVLEHQNLPGPQVSLLSNEAERHHLRQRFFISQMRKAPSTPVLIQSFLLKTKR